jgi:hypothetical protein
VPFHDVYFDLIYVPARIYPKVRALPFPGLPYLFNGLKNHSWPSIEAGMDYFPGLVGLTSIAYLFATRRDWREEGDAFPRRLHVLLTLLLVLMTVKGLVRVSPTQLIQAIVLAFAVLAVVMQRVTSKQKGLRVLVVCCLFVAAIPSTIVTERALRRALANGRNMYAKQADDFAGAPGGLLRDSCRVPVGLERMRCFYLKPDEVHAIEYVEAHTTPSDTIYVGAGRHDKLLQNDLVFYFVSERMSGTKWHDLHPGIQTTQEIQAEMIADLKRTGTTYVVLDSSFDDWIEPNQSRFSSGVRLLDDYIRQNYSQVASFGPISILRLNSSGAILPTT